MLHLINTNYTMSPGSKGQRSRWTKNINLSQLFWT